MDPYEAYEEYQELEDYYTTGRHTPRRAKNRPVAKKPRPADVLAQLSDFNDNLSAWVPSYAAALDPRHHEREWLIDSVGPFYRNSIITDVTHRVKGGKEANVYRCTGNPDAGFGLIAAKLYRPRLLRMLKNDAIYKAGRQLRGEDGKLLKGRREKVALAQKTKFGKELDTAWWIQNEFSTQQKLFAAGAAVPRPIAHEGNTILMDFIGDERMPAPALIDSAPEPGQAAELFSFLMDNVRLMLDHHLVHGDLSPYNILYWDGRPFIIDFPQVVDARNNPHAYDLLRRDVARVCAYFVRFGVRADAEQLARDLWLPYMGSLG